MQDLKRSTEVGFQVTNHGVKPAEIRQIHGMAAINDHWLMDAAHLCHSMEASLPIEDHLTPSSQGVLGPVCDRYKREGFNHGHLDVNGVTSLIKGDGNSGI